MSQDRNVNLHCFENIKQHSASEVVLNFENPYCRSLWNNSKGGSSRVRCYAVSTGIFLLTYWRIVENLVWLLCPEYEGIRSFKLPVTTYRHGVPNRKTYIFSNVWNSNLATLKGIILIYKETKQIKSTLSSSSVNILLF